jgi:hypothetical protein
MKRFLFLIIFLLAGGLFSNVLAQKLQLITLDKKDSYFVKPRPIVLAPGDTLKFKSIDGEFDIYVPDAINFLKIKETNLKVRVNSKTNPESSIYVLREKVADSIITFSVYCITNNSWPDAPPKIIIVNQ